MLLSITAPVHIFVPGESCFSGWSYSTLRQPADLRLFALECNTLGLISMQRQLQQVLRTIHDSENISTSFQSSRLYIGFGVDVGNISFLGIFVVIELLAILHFGIVKNYR